MPTTEIKMTTTTIAGSRRVVRDPATFTKSRSEVDVIRLTNANPVPSPSTPQSLSEATIRVRLSVAEANNMIASVVLPPASPGASPQTINVAAPPPPAPGNDASHIDFRLRPGQSAEWMLLNPLPDRPTLPVQANGRKRRSLTLNTIPHHPDDQDHADYHVDC